MMTTKQAGVDMRGEFDLDEHRWRRFLVATDRLDHTLDEIAAAYNGQGGIESFATILNRYPKPGQLQGRRAQPP
jgi:hypothetical protein